MEELVDIFSNGVEEVRRTIHEDGTVTTQKRERWSLGDKWSDWVDF